MTQQEIHPLPAKGNRQSVEVFEKARPRLLSIAYRILGSRMDAEDAVQDTFLKWQAVDMDSIDAPGAWLTTTCTRRAIDMLRSASRSRVDYVGNWLPEPVQATSDNDVEAQMELSSSLSTAFLLALERLSPRERAAYLLHEIFEMPYADLAKSLDMSEPGCRKLVSRARARISVKEARYQPSKALQDDLLVAFHDAIRNGKADSLAARLASDVRLVADGGGKSETLSDILEGGAVLTFLTERLTEFWATYDWTICNINGSRGIILRDGQIIVASVSFAYDTADRVSHIFIVRNPDKLARLDGPSIH